MKMIYFYDLPVYRISEADYKEEWENSAQNQTLIKNQTVYNKYPELKMPAEIALRARFGGPWQYNEIIGFIKLHILGSQIRGEYHVNQKKRQMRSRTKIFSYSTDKIAIEMDVPITSSNKEIYDIILSYINSCRKKLNKKRFIDDSLLRAIGPHTDWKKLFWNIDQH